MTPPDADDGKANHAADSFTWDIPIMAGNPEAPEHAAKYNPDTTENGWFAAPDNVAFDGAGRLWIATDNGANRSEEHTSELQSIMRISYSVFYLKQKTNTNH